MQWVLSLQQLTTKSASATGSMTSKSRQRAPSATCTFREPADRLSEAPVRPATAAIPVAS